MATVNFVVLGGTGDDAGYPAAGTTERILAGLVTLKGSDVGL